HRHVLPLYNPRLYPQHRLLGKTPHHKQDRLHKKGGSMSNKKVIGIDLGATNIRGAVVNDNELGNIASQRIHSDGTVEEVLQDIHQVIDALNTGDIAAIGIGVPSVVDVKEGIVYDVQYIPSWKEVPLKQHLEAKYKKPVFVNNDANCFVLGEYYF